MLLCNLNMFYICELSWCLLCFVLFWFCCCCCCCLISCFFFCCFNVFVFLTFWHLYQNIELSTWTRSKGHTQTSAFNLALTHFAFHAQVTLFILQAIWARSHEGHVQFTTAAWLVWIYKKILFAAVFFSSFHPKFWFTIRQVCKRENKSLWLCL